MKPRLKMDGFVLAVVVVISLGVYLFPQLFYAQRHYDDIYDFFGMIFILKGGFIRMSARGHKFACSPGGLGLAEDGLYAYVRNPMYLGTFLIGVGCTLMIWPWWAVIIFAALFFLRFMPLITREEDHLKKTFGQEYEHYCQRVPRFFPSLTKLLGLKLAFDCPWHELWSTKERRVIWVMPSIMIVAEMGQEWLLLRSLPSRVTFLPFVLAFAAFGILLAFVYLFKNGKNSK